MKTGTSKAEFDKIRARLHGNLKSYFPELSSESPSIVLSAISRHTYSNVYLFRVPQHDGRRAQTRGLAVKVFLTASGGQDAARHQYAALTTAWPAFKSSTSLTIPRPLDFFPELSAVVTERVKGESLQRLFNASVWLPGRNTKLVRCSESAGSWLRKFHRATELPPGLIDVEDKLKQWRGNVRNLGAIGFAPQLCRRLNSIAETLGRDIRGVELPMASVHGDFTVDNVLVDGDRIITVDLGGKDRNAIYHDIASFLNSLALISLSWPVRRSLVERTSGGFLSGYFGTGEYCSSAVDFLRLVGLVSVALEIFHRRTVQSLLRWRIRRYFERLFRQFVTDANG